ncbi:MAG TPA: ACP phosphodiesterase [Gallionellaceae bacterium]|nr:ACP phosphodiesterase [Gallionellaceae bacterium]
MNFLAHALLSGNESHLIVGGVAGDWVKGPLPGSLPADLARGVALHRAIDHYAETHPAFCRSRGRVSKPRKRYAGILVDIFYDHLLARDWENVHHRPLHDYCAQVYEMIAARLDDLPPDAHHALQLMASQDWLSSYATIEGIADVMRRMARRVRHPEMMEHSEQELVEHFEGFSEDYREWLADITVFCREWRERTEL